MKLEINLIDVPANRRKLDPVWVEALSDLFSSQGQQTAIEVVARGDRYNLVYGGHRLAAAKLLGWPEIGAVVKAPGDYANEADIVLAEITENFARRELSVLDRAVDITRWRDAYNAAHTISKGGRKAKDVSPEELTAKFAVSFSVVAQKAFNLSERTIFNAIKVASIAAELRDRIALHAIADNQSELLALATEPADRQEKIVALLTADPAQAASVADAVAAIDRTPKPAAEPKWQKLSTTFSLLKEADQDRFFALHEASITRWLKGRSN